MSLLVIEVPPDTPVLVGVAAVQDRRDDFQNSDDALGLMALALKNAAADAGDPDLLGRADEILVPKGMWKYSDPGRLLADRLGSKSATTGLAEIGVLQQSLITRACQRIASGDAQLVLVTGAEARYRSICAKKAGGVAVETTQTDVVPGVVLEPDAELWSPVEAAAGLAMPVGYYAIIDSALRYKQGITLEQHRDQMASCYSHYSEIAAANPDAWSDLAVDASFVRNHSPKNRMLAFPYTKFHNSQWNVNQGAGLIFCSAAMAAELQIDRSKWVFPLASTEANYMTVTASRKDLGGSVGFRVAGEVAMEMAGLSFDDIHLRELYSCFPSAVRVQQEEFGLEDAGDTSVTGAMTFAGGPLNNFVFQATVKMAHILRRQPAEVGLVTNVSGMLTKQACALWSATPNKEGWGFADVTERVRRESELCEVVAEYNGEGVVAGYTVLYEGDQPSRAVAVLDISEGRRTVAYSQDESLIQAMLEEECCGKSVTVHDGQFS
jgi:acetyl-CoA C-acetyltransferase